MSEAKRILKNQLYEQFARVAKALAHQHRIELIDLLAQAERSVEDLASELGLPVANVSQHLQVLRMAQMVEIRREGSRKFYRVSDGKAFEIWRAIRTFGEERLAEVDRVVKSFFGEREKLEPLSAEQLSQRIKDGDVIVLDVRPENEFNAGHIEGAVSIPIHELKRRLKELSRKREIVAYCRGPYCVYARDAVTELTTHGFKARRLEIGLPDWKALGLPVTTTAQTL
jgi:rhodanese-related sulfurtransferase/DNA-binding transcriptional ArsR family regulator